MKQKIFLVDDEEMNVELMKDALSSKYSSFEFTGYATGEECLKAMDQNPKIIFLDYWLNSQNQGAMNGLQVLKNIKKGNPDTEVVIVSSQDKIEVAVNVMKNGAFDYIIKGEGAFHRAQQVVYNIIKYAEMKKTANMYKRLTLIFAFAFLAVLFIIVILQMQGLILDFPSFSI
ncbi:MAG: response regulator [Bacteroidia bacterium]|nr:response regulator [Bacteroidia bacterium]